MISKYDKIKQIAYMKWLDAQCPSGKDTKFWLEAEQELYHVQDIDDHRNPFNANRVYHPLDIFQKQSY